MPSSVVWLVFVLLAAALMLALRRATELFVVSVRGQNVQPRRGRLPPRLLREIEDVVRLSAVHDAEIRVVVSDGRPRVVPHPGLPEDALQRLRNVVGTWRTAQIRAGRRVR